MKFAYSLLAHIMLCMGSVYAQQENWDAYMARYGSKPGSVMVDMGLSAAAPDKLLPYLVITGPRARPCSNPNGMPDTSEINEMETMLEVTGGILSGVTAKKLAGTFTYNCERLNYYYVRDTVPVRNAINRLYKTHYGSYTHTLKIKHDPMWLSYRTFLYPDSTTQSWMANNKAILAMVQGGDNLAGPRDITHTLYFTSDSARTAFANYATSHRYKVAGTSNAKTIVMPYEIVVGRNSRVVMDSIMAMESELRVAAKPLGGYYKGWEAKGPLAASPGER